MNFNISETDSTGDYTCGLGEGSEVGTTTVPLGVCGSSINVL